MVLRFKGFFVGLGFMSFIFCFLFVRTVVYLCLDSVEVSELEDLVSAQFYFCMVNFVQFFSIFGDFFFSGVMFSFFQEFQGLGGYRGDYLRISVEEGRYQSQGEKSCYLIYVVQVFGQVIFGVIVLFFGRVVGEVLSFLGKYLLSVYQCQVFRKVFCVCGYIKESLYFSV